MITTPIFSRLRNKQSKRRCPKRSLHLSLTLPSAKSHTANLESSSYSALTSQIAFISQKKASHFSSPFKSKNQSVSLFTRPMLKVLPNTTSVAGASPVSGTCLSARPTLTAGDPPSPTPALSLSRVPRPLRPTPTAKPDSPRPTPTHAPRAPTAPSFSGRTFPAPLGRAERSLGISKEPLVHKAPDAPGSGQLPPSARSPQVIVLAPHVDGLVHVALGGRLLARALHRDEDRAGAAPSPPASSLPPSPGPAGAAPAAARSAPRRSFPRRSPARPQEPAPATPPRAGGAPSPASRAQAPPPPRAPPPRGSAWPAIGWGGGRGRARQCPPRGSGQGVGTRPRTWGAGAARGRGEVAGGSGEARGRGRGRGRGGGGPAGGGLRAPAGALLRSPQSAGEVAVLCLNTNPKRVAECERACVTSGGAAA